MLNRKMNRKQNEDSINASVFGMRTCQLWGELCSYHNILFAFWSLCSHPDRKKRSRLLQVILSLAHLYSKNPISISKSSSMFSTYLSLRCTHFDLTLYYFWPKFGKNVWPPNCVSNFLANVDNWSTLLSVNLKSLQKRLFFLI